MVTRRRACQAARGLLASGGRPIVALLSRLITKEPQKQRGVGREALSIYARPSRAPTRSSTQPPRSDIALGHAKVA